MDNQNAKTALKQIKREIAADYGMNYEDVFDVIENAKSNGVLSKYFKELETKKLIETGMYNTHVE